MKTAKTTNTAQKPLHGMVLGAGLGTRLRPLTAHRPKPAVPVGQTPLGWVAAEQLRQAGVTHLWMNTHHLADRLQAAMQQAMQTAAMHMPLSFLHEPTLLGTGGGIRRALERTEGHDLIVFNGDVLFTPDLRRVIEHHRALDAIATMVVRPHPNPDALGSIEVDSTGRVRRILGEPTARQQHQHTQPLPPLQKYMFTGVHVLSPRALKHLPTSGCIIRTAYRTWMAQQTQAQAHQQTDSVTVGAVVDTSPWSDLGTLPAYHAANMACATRSSAFFTDKATLPIHPSAVIGERARINTCVIGAHAHIAPGVHLTRCVVWDGAHVTGSHENAILGEFGVVSANLHPP